MTLEEIMEKAKEMHDSVSSIDTVAEARQAVTDATAMMYYLAQHVLALKTEEDVRHVPPHMD